jgi:hypothetical protein
MELLGAVIAVYCLKSLVRVSAEPFRNPWVTGVCGTALALVVLAFLASK